MLPQKTADAPERARGSAAQMKTADQGVDAIDPGDFLAMAHDIDDPAVPTAGHDHQTTIRFVNQHAFVDLVIHRCVLPGDHPVGARGGHRDLA